MRKQITLPNFGGFYGETFTDTYCSANEVDGDLIDYKATYLAVAEGPVMKEYRERFEGSPFSGLEFVELDSPRFYNFETDKIVASVEFDPEAVLQVIGTDDFAAWLKENYSSRDGFFSFVPTAISDFLAEFEAEAEYSRCVSVVLEYYFRDLDCVNPDDLELVWECIVEKANETEPNE